MAGIGALGKKVAEDFQRLARLEARFVAESAKPQLQRGGMSVAFVLTAVVLAHLGVIFLFLGVAAALALVLPVWASLLIVGGVLFLVAAILVLAARSGFKSAANVVPERAIDRVKQDMQWVREQTS
jgi:ABC-type transport system involved in Fe-S cluster assembly fused permease/ATPase subunit